jgi:hypothetical protein
MKRKLTSKSLMIIIAMFLLPMASFAQYVTSSQTIGSGTNQMDIVVSIDAGLSQAKFEITGPATVWFGFSFNTTVMSPGSYTILANVSGGNPAEYIMVNHAAPTLQPVQNLTNITSSTAAGRKTFIFYRALSTGDPNDYVFAASAGLLNIAWAYGTSLVLDYHADRGGSSLNFINPCSATPTTTLPAIHICQGDSVQIFGQYKNTTGNYSMTYPVSWACDSIVMQPLVVHSPAITSLTPVAICAGDSAMIFGQYQSVPGIYSMTYQSVYSCDSTVTQELVVTSGQAYVKDTLFVGLCEGDSVNLGGTWINAQGNFIVFSAIFGCDTLFDLYVVTEVIIDTTVTLVGSALMVSSGYASYSWIDCATGQTATGSSNSNSFTPLFLGSYRVEISHEGCVVTSGCHTAGNISIGESTGQQPALKVFPNPAANHLWVELPYGARILQISDLTGRVVLNSTVWGETNAVIDLTALNQGAYMLFIVTDQQTQSAKLLISR